MTLESHGFRFKGILIQANVFMLAASFVLQNDSKLLT